MFRAMRRIRQQLTDEEARAILERNQEGVLALHGDDDWPYAVPVNYQYRDGHLYFHGATQGHKADALRKDAKASICVIDADTVVPEKLATDYLSVIAFGYIRTIDDPEKKLEAIRSFGRHFHGPEAAVEADIKASWDRLAVYDMELVHVTGKMGLYVMQRRIQSAHV